MSNSLEERLKTHSAAFDGLLSLIPAKYYYDDATQDQWQQKKKPKDEQQRNRRAKLDPNAGLDADEYDNGAATAQEVMKNREKTAKEVALPQQKPKAPVTKSNEQAPNDETSASDSDFIPMELRIEFDDDGNESNQPPSPVVRAKKGKVLSEEEKKQKEARLEQLRAKLASKIEVSRALRKAPGSQAPGAPKSRLQILEERKRKQELRKRKREAEPEENSGTDSESDSDSGSENEAADSSAATNDENVLFGNIVFNDGSRVTSDLTRLRQTLQKKAGKGPANKDIKAHLAKLEQKKQKLAQMDSETRAKYEEKDQWQRLMSHAEGVKVKDDEKLLKKALKRKEKQKLKSEIEWRDRKQNVKDTVAARQKRREENLKARRENKGKKGNKAVRLRKFTGTVHKNKRAGFEGTAKSKRAKK